MPCTAGGKKAEARYLRTVTSDMSKNQSKLRTETMMCDVTNPFPAYRLLDMAWVGTPDKQVVVGIRSLFGSPGCVGCLDMYSTEG